MPDKGRTGKMDYGNVILGQNKLSLSLVHNTRLKPVSVSRGSRMNADIKQVAHESQVPRQESSHVHATEKGIQVNQLIQRACSANE